MIVQVDSLKVWEEDGVSVVCKGRGEFCVAGAVLAVLVWVATSVLVSDDKDQVLISNFLKPL